MPAIPIIAGVAGIASTVKGMSDANKASKAAANAPAATVNIPGLQAQAQNIAQQNAAASAALENQYNPGASQLRSGSLEALLAQLNSSDPRTAALADMIAAQAGQGLSTPATQQYDSALTRQAIEAASRDLALGGELPQDVRNLVARNALARAGSVTGNLGLGRDITARDLGLTSLDLYNRRLANAATIGGQEAALESGNAQLRQRAGELGLQAELYGRNNLFDSANFLQSMNSGDFARALAAAQFGQNIAQPVSGLDPGSVANLAVGNANATAQQAQNAAAIKAQQANSLAGLGTGLIGLGASTYLNRPAAPIGATLPPASTLPTFTATLPTFNYGLGKN